MEWQDEEEKAERSALPARESATLTKAKRSTRLKYKKKKKTELCGFLIYIFLHSQLLLRATSIGQQVEVRIR